jgi:transcriptional regulator with XRE-family HTH domain
MDVGSRLREIRECLKLSQGDVQERTGLLRCYISRVENGHTVPSVETLEKMARAFGLQTYQLFIENGDGLAATAPPKRSEDWALLGRKGPTLRKRFQNCLARMSDRDRAILLLIANNLKKSGSSR